MGIAIKEIARELEIKNKEVMRTLLELGAQIGSMADEVEEDMANKAVELICRRLGRPVKRMHGARPEPPPVTEPPPAEAPAPVAAPAKPETPVQNMMPTPAPAKKKEKAATVKAEPAETGLPEAASAAPEETPPVAAKRAKETDIRQAMAKGTETAAIPLAPSPPRPVEKNDERPPRHQDAVSGAVTSDVQPEQEKGGERPVREKKEERSGRDGTAAPGARRQPSTQAPVPSPVQSPKVEVPLPPKEPAKGSFAGARRNKNVEQEAERRRRAALKEREGSRRTLRETDLDIIEEDGLILTREDAAALRGAKARKRQKAQKHTPQGKRVKAIIKPKPTRVKLPASLMVKELASLMGIEAAAIIKKLMELGVMANINQFIDQETAALVATDFGLEVELEEIHDETELPETEEPDDEAALVARPPIVTIMGHVDHGKTSLLDAIRRSRITETEAGGITQHIGAYQVEYHGKRITFLDTPGHEAFTAMRARGAQATDIAVLVVAADDGVMPQTVEAINHAKAAGVPIIVAINKMDKPGANPERIKQQLTEYELVPEEWGGETICVPVSAVTKEGIDNLLEMILLVAEMRELRANPARRASGVVIEAKLDRGRGPVATVLVQNGTLHVGEAILVGSVTGHIRAMFNEKGENVSEAGPSVPVEILGLDEVPEAGDTFQVVMDDKLARQVADKRQEKKREEMLQTAKRVSLGDLFAQVQQGEVKELRIILKADVQGSVEALREALERLSNQEVRVAVIHGAVGGISDTDVMLAAASNAIIIGFNVRPDPTASRLAEREQVDIRLYRVIYNAIEDVTAAMQGMLTPTYQETVLGRAEVRAIFKVPKVGVVAGCYVTDGKAARGAEVRVLRDNVVVFEGQVASLKRFKDDAREVQEGFECGVGIQNFNDVKEGDVLEFFRVEEVKPGTGVAARGERAEVGA